MLLRLYLLLVLALGVSAASALTRDEARSLATGEPEAE